MLPYRIRKETKKRVRYFTPFAQASGLSCVDLRAVYGRSSVIDGRKDAHVQIAKRWLEESLPAVAGGDDGELDEVQEWMNRWRLAEFHPETGPDDLRKTQEWMQADDATQW